jgi:hypothetical protein
VKPVALPTDPAAAVTGLQALLADWERRMQRVTPGATLNHYTGMAKALRPLLPLLPQLRSALQSAPPGAAPTEAAKAAAAVVGHTAIEIQAQLVPARRQLSRIVRGRALAIADMTRIQADWALLEALNQQPDAPAPLRLLHTLRAVGIWVHVAQHVFTAVEAQQPADRGAAGAPTQSAVAAIASSTAAIQR